MQILTNYYYSKEELNEKDLREEHNPNKLLIDNKIDNYNYYEIYNKSKCKFKFKQY